MPATEGGWQATHSSVTVLRHLRARECLNASSPKLCAGRVQPARDAKPLALFENLILIESRVEDEGQGRSVIVDCTSYVGGLVWAVDWCPSLPTPVPSRKERDKDVSRSEEFLAVSAHPKGVQSNKIGVPVSGRGLIQIWSVRQCSQPLGSNPIRPRLAIAHNGLVTWDVKWCPNPSAYVSNWSPGPDCHSPIGVLAAALGDGSVEVYCVPNPEEVLGCSALRQGGQNGHANGECALPVSSSVSASNEPLVVALKPVVSIAGESMNCSIVSSIDWLPSFPNDLLLLGCWDGHVSIWQLPQCDGHSPQQLAYHRCEYLAIRRAVWLRTTSPPSAADSSHRNLFCTAGHSGKLVIWDAGDIFYPVLSKALTRYWLLDVATSGDPLSIFVAVEDGVVRQIPLDVSCFSATQDSVCEYRYTGENEGAICTITCSTCNTLVAYAGEDGDIALFERENCPDARYRRPHFCAGAVRQDGDVLRLITARDAGRTMNLFTGGSSYVDRKMADSVLTLKLPSNPEGEVCALWCVKFSPNGGNTTWLASGGRAGILRLQRVSVGT